MKNPKGAWKMLVGAILLQFAVVGLTINAFSVYLPYLMERCGLSNTENANVVMIRTGAAFVTLWFVGKIYARLELRRGITLSVLLAAASLLLYAAADRYWMLVLAAVCSGVSYGMGGMYAVSLLIHRWFRVHGALALGVCTATTGLAVVVGAPVSTAMVEYGSLQFALQTEAVFLALCGLGCAWLIRSRPADLPEEPRPAAAPRVRIRFRSIHVAAMLIGSLGNTAFQFLAVHFTTQGFEAFQVSTLVSTVGVSLMVSKFLFGESVDRLGAYRTNWMFFGTCAAGAVLCCLAGSFSVAMAAVILLGLGISFSTVGLSVYAEDLSAPEDYSASLREVQLWYQCGGMLAGPLAGVLADWSGSYVPFYGFAVCACLLALGIIQWNYRKAGKTQKSGF